MAENSEIHAAAQEAHFIQRARERFGLKLAHEQYRYLVRKVVEVLPGTRFHSRCADPRRTRWRIRAGGHPMVVIYDEGTDRLVTCYLPAAFLAEERAQQKLARPGHRDWLHKARRLEKRKARRRASVPYVELAAIEAPLPCKS